MISTTKFRTSELQSSEPCQASKIECFPKRVNRWKPLTSFSKHCILNVWQGSEHASGVKNWKEFSGN